jgi:hypothetical protein
MRHINDQENIMMRSVAHVRVIFTMTVDQKNEEKMNLGRTDQILSQITVEKRVKMTNQYEILFMKHMNYYQ